MPRPKPKGRKPDKEMRDMLRLELAAPWKDPKDRSKDAKKFRGDRLVARATVRAAIHGDVGAIREVFNRIDGAVTQKIGGDPEAPIQFSSEVLAHTMAALTDAELEVCERFLSRLAAQARVTPRLAGPVIDHDSG